MDIRYFEFLDRFKRGDKFNDDTCLRGEMDNHTRLLTDELGVRIPPGALIPPHLAGPADESGERAARRAKLIRVVRRLEDSGAYERLEHQASAFLADAGLLEATEKVCEIEPRKVKMFVVIDKFDKNQCSVKCPCGEEFDDWATLFHTCPECGAVDEGV